MMSRPDTRAIWYALAQVSDPELPLSLVDLGLIYGVRIDGSGQVEIDLTFTSIGCPGMEMIMEDIEQAVAAVPGVTGVSIEIVWSPPWSKAQLTPKGRVLLQATGLSL